MSADNPYLASYRAALPRAPTSLDLCLQVALAHNALGVMLQDFFKLALSPSHSNQEGFENMAPPQRTDNLPRKLSLEPPASLAQFAQSDFFKPKEHKIKEVELEKAFRREEVGIKGLECSNCTEFYKTLGVQGLCNCTSRHRDKFKQGKQ
jgi:hypothetical protein